MNASFDQVDDKTTVFDANGGGFYTRGAVDPTSPLGEQAAWIQSTVNQGFYSSSSSLRFNELSLTYNLPTSLAERLLRVRSASVTFAGRNLALWTNYVGKDPNVDTSHSLTEVSADDGTAIPQPRNFALRFTLGL